MDAELDEVMRREVELLQPGVRADAGRLSELLHADFVEFGASGRRWDRASIIESLGTEDGEPVFVDALGATELAPSTVLVTYEAERYGRRTLRSSIWVRADGVWRVLFHQGTVVSSSADSPPAVAPERSSDPTS